MVDVIISCPSETALTAQVKSMSSIAFSPVRDDGAGDILGDSFNWRSYTDNGNTHPLPESAVTIATHRTKYRTKDVDGGPAEFTSDTYFLWRMHETDWDSLLALSPLGQLPGTGGAQIIYGIGMAGGPWGVEPGNKTQVAFA